MKILLAPSIFLIILSACAKPNNKEVKEKALEGTWIFTHVVSTTSWNWGAAHDSIILYFLENKRYRYTQYSAYPVDNGDYQIIMDSLLVLKSDTTHSALYTFLHHHPFGTYPDSYYVYIEEKYLWRKPNANQLIIERQWRQSSNPNIPYTSSFYFKRKL